MPRKRAEETLIPTLPKFAGDLSDDARSLIAQIEERWDLNPPVRALLKIAAESLTVAEQCAEILAVEGLVVRDQRGSCKCHPAATLARDARNNAANTLAKVLASLQ